MRDRLKTLAALVAGTSGENRRLFVPVLVLVLAGAILALGAAYPLLSPFLYSMF